MEKKAVWSEMEAFGQFKGRKGRGSSLVLKNGNRRPKAEIAGVEGRDLGLGASTWRSGSGHVAVEDADLVQLIFDELEDVIGCYPRLWRGSFLRFELT